MSGWKVHYNLVDPALRGKSDSTTVRLATATEVDKIGIFALPDGLLDSLGEAQPHLLAPGKVSEPYSFTRTLAELGGGEVSGLALAGVMPHMHQRGRTYRLRVKPGGGAPERCGVDVKRWDFHWQRMYFYETAIALADDAEFSVDCDCDTTDSRTPISPGWGTNNGVCLAVLYFTLPRP